MEKYLGVKLIKAEPAKGYNNKLYTYASPAGVKVEEGYKVVYEDGYESWSPKDVFEKAYRKINGLTFGLAMEAMKFGKKVSKPGWLGYIALQVPDKNSKMNQPYIYASCKDGEVVPAVINQIDMWAEDWFIVE